MAPLAQSPPSSLTFPAASTLPFPNSLRQNRSFVKLAHLLGLTSTESSRSQDGEVKIVDRSESPQQDGSGLEDEDEDEGIDEDSLMWDAQTALIAHHPALAIKHYTIAAGPPYRSSAACLALGNLLTRGSGLAPPPQTPGESPRYSAMEKGKGRAYSFGPVSPSQKPASPQEAYRRGSAPITSVASPPKSNVGRFMDFVWPTSPPLEVTFPPVPERTYTDLVGIGWAIPKEGKRAVRDVEGMGIAGGWFVLGLGWIVDRHMLSTSPIDESVSDEDAIVMGRRSKHSMLDSKFVKNAIQTYRAEEVDANGETSSEGTILKTPSDGERESPEDAEKVVKLIYDLLQPLLRLYRNGHIQATDPVYLPPIAYAQLPSSVRPQGDLQKRRNVWHLGGTVLPKLLDLKIMQGGSDERRSASARRRAVEVMTRYILAMTCPIPEAEDQYRKIISIGQSGLEYPDEIVRHAAKHLDILSPPVETPALVPYKSRRAEYPFPSMIPPNTHVQTPQRSSSGPSQIKNNKPFRHAQKVSISSICSVRSTRSMRLPPIKSCPSSASLAESIGEVSISSAKRSSGALDSLRRVHAQSVADLRASGRIEEESGARWPILSSWSYGKAKERVSKPPSESATPTETSSLISTTIDEDTKSANNEQTSITISHLSPSRDTPQSTLQIPTIRTVASTPTFGSFGKSDKRNLKLPSPGLLTPRPFDNLHSDINTTIDPALAAAELASTLTKRVKCGVCRIEGINFPECRKCGLTFCSRECRVGDHKAGNGKKHVCGVWEGRKGLSVPEKIDGRRESKVGATTVPVGAEVLAC